MTDTITSLIEKLEGAEVGSRELDREIMALSYRYEQRHIGASCWDDDDDTCCPGAKHLDWVWVDPATDQWKTNARDGFEFTTSLDAALALAERIMPGWGWSAGQGHGEKAYARLDTLDGCDFEEAYAATPALALCAAILRAQSEAR